MKGKENLKIFVIDDDDTSRFLTTRMLELVRNQQEFICHEFKSALCALDFLSNRQNIWPDVILLDINMPLMSGWEFIDRVLDQWDLFTKTKLYMLSSSNHLLDFEQGLARKEVKRMFGKPLQLEDAYLILNSEYSE